MLEEQTKSQEVLLKELETALDRVRHELKEQEQEVRKTFFVSGCHSGELELWNVV